MPFENSTTGGRGIKAEVMPAAAISAVHGPKFGQLAGQCNIPTISSSSSSPLSNGSPTSNSPSSPFIISNQRNETVATNGHRKNSSQKVKKGKIIEKKNTKITQMEMNSTGGSKEMAAAAANRGVEATKVLARGLDRQQQQQHQIGTFFGYQPNGGAAANDNSYLQQQQQQQFMAAQQQQPQQMIGGGLLKAHFFKEFFPCF